MWPKLSNIDGSVASTIKSYANDNLKASGLNAWVRAFSGANSGLILESNTDFKLFSAAGEASALYGGIPNRSGVIGRTWGNVAVSSDPGRALRPSPIITSFNSKEGQDQISRTCEFSITCFSLQQLEEIQTYFMEPGYSVALEWGHNTENSVGGLVSTGDAGSVLKQIADTTLNVGALEAIRSATNGEYDIFLGFIVGSTVSSDGENFKVDVKLRGSPSLPTYLQSQNKISPKSVGVQPDPDKSKLLYDESELVADAEDKKKDRRFKTMFNELPAFRQTESVKELLTEVAAAVSATDFINFDRVDYKKITEFFAKSGPEFYSFGASSTIEVEIESGVKAEVDKEKLFSRNKYIKLKLAVDILNKMGKVDSYMIGDKPVSFNINIENSIIGAFPFMFSTKASKLIIPGFVPNFKDAYLLSAAEVTQLSNGRLLTSDKPDPLKSVQIPGVKGFVEFQKSLNEFGLKEKAFYYGYLKNLYVNFDMFKEKIQQNTKTIREIFQDILNELSSAANSFWNFQIVEGEATDGNILITVIDENWIGENPSTTEPTEFKHSGIGSPFLNSSLDISIPAEMANKIINERLGNVSNPEMQNIAVNDKSLFNAGPDLFLKRVGNAGGDTTDTTTPDPPTGSESKQKLDVYVTAVNAAIRSTEKVEGGYIKHYDGPDGSGNLIKMTNEKGETTLLGNTNSTDPLIAEANSKFYELNIAVNTERQDSLKSKLTANLEKLDIVPNPTKAVADIEAANIQTALQNNFFVYCFDDTEYFDAIKNTYFNSKNKTGGGLSQPLPIKYSFTIFGNSGIRRGDTFKIFGIPSKYAEKGVFQVSAIEHSISGMRWETTVEGLYRQNQ